MKIFSRNFTRTEKILILILALILVGLVYYRFVYVSIEETIQAANAEADQLQSEMDVMEIKLMSLQSMQNELDSMDTGEGASRMESYNNSAEEIAYLNDILADALEYSVSFGDVTRSGNQIRRNFTLQYRTKNYAAAEQIMKELCESPNRCLVGDVQCSVADDKTVTISAAAAFYETMVGGVADSGLPADAAATAEDTQ